MMNPDIKAQWVAALRSGEYVQGFNKLVTLGINGVPVSHCCLGVLCELAVTAGVIPPRNGRLYGDAPFSLPTTVMVWAGLTRGDPRVLDGKTLSILNDHGVGFEEIADVIEDYL